MDCLRARKEGKQISPVSCDIRSSIRRKKREQSKAVEENFAKRRENNSRLPAKSFTHTLKMKERKNDSRLWLAIIQDWCPLSVNACFGPGIGLCDNRYRDKLSVIVVRMLGERFSLRGHSVECLINLCGQKRVKYFGIFMIDIEILTSKAEAANFIAF